MQLLAFCLLAARNVLEADGIASHNHSSYRRDAATDPTVIMRSSGNNIMANVSALFHQGTRVVGSSKGVIPRDGPTKLRLGNIYHCPVAAHCRRRSACCLTRTAAFMKKASTLTSRGGVIPAVRRGGIRQGPLDHQIEQDRSYCCDWCPRPLYARAALCRRDPLFRRQEQVRHGGPETPDRRQA